LNFFSNTLKGTYVIFAAGTGIIPFIDLIAFTVRYMTYQINWQILKGKQTLIIPKEKELFDKLMKII
jgi:hypothetical protein